MRRKRRRTRITRWISLCTICIQTVWSYCYTLKLNHERITLHLKRINDIIQFFSAAIHLEGRWEGNAIPSQNQSPQAF